MIRMESIIGTCLSGKGLERTRFGPYDAVIPEVSGTVSITGKHEFFS
jgi:trans-L-3-hydroxyproline dehydratase